jgi:uncharacterized protein with ATP-grasp and redox domains
LGLSPGKECYGCFRRGFSDYTSRAGLSFEDFERLIAIVDTNLEKGLIPPLAGSESWALLRKLSLFTEDIFSVEKEHFTTQMVLQYGKLKSLFLKTENPRSMALAAATWCNLIDVGQGNPLPDTEYLATEFSTPLLIDEREHFLNALDNSRTLLVLGDNAGETVMDRLFLDLSLFPGRKFYMTREFPVMNDAVMKDAEMAGLQNAAELLTSGMDVPSVIPEMLRGRALEVFQSADVILAKGQGNLEGLFGLNDPRVYHSFVVKCDVVSRATGVARGGGVFCRFISSGGKNAYL